MYLKYKQTLDLGTRITTLKVKNCTSVQGVHKVFHELKNVENFSTLSACSSF